MFTKKIKNRKNNKETQISIAKMLDLQLWHQAWISRFLLLISVMLLKILIYIITKDKNKIDLNSTQKLVDDETKEYFDGLMDIRKNIYGMGDKYKK